MRILVVTRNAFLTYPLYMMGFISLKYKQGIAQGILRYGTSNLLLNAPALFSALYRKVLLTLVPVVIFQFHLTAQTYFSKRYDINNENLASYSQNILECPSGYFLNFVSQTPGSSNDRIGFLTLDYNGVISGSVKIYADPSFDMDMGRQGSFIKLNGSEHYACVATKMQWVTGGRFDRGWLLKLNSALDTLWTKTYTDVAPHDTSIMFRNIRELNDGGFIIVGLRNPVSGIGLLRIGLYRVDNAGNLLWQRKFGAGNNINFQPEDVSGTSDKGYIIGAAFQPETTGNTQGSDALIIKTDSAGLQQWDMHLGNSSCRENFAMVDQSKDGNIQVGTIYSDTCWSYSEWKARINFLKIRNNKTIVWDKKYGLCKYDLEFNKVRVLPDGDIIGTGWYYDVGLTGVQITGWIIRTDSAGNEKWYREYLLLNGKDSWNCLFNVIPTSDNGFAACGFVLPAQPDSGTQDSWLLKVDSLGCESPGNCWVGINEFQVKTFTPDKPFIIYPNPASERLIMEFHDNPEGAEVEIVNINGQRCINTAIPSRLDRFEINLQTLIPGIYIVKVRMGDQILFHQRLLVNR